MKYKAILFDLDGTIIDSSRGIINSLVYALKYYDITEENPDGLKRFIGPPMRDSFMNFYGFNADKACEAIDYYREYYSKTGIYECDLYPGVSELIKKLKADGYRILLATSKPLFYGDLILKHFDIMPYFDATFGSDLSGHNETKSDIIKNALKTMQLNAADCLMVGDRKYDIEGAHACNVSAAGITVGFGSREELVEAGAEYVCDSFDELYELIQAEK